MAKLSGTRIENEVEGERIIISPFDKNNLGPNSYDLTLGPILKTYQTQLDFRGKTPLDFKRENPTNEHEIDAEKGFVLFPNMLYLAHTNEVAGSNYYVPCIEGRSSVARLGIQVHLTAGFGDVGFIGQWTLEILVVQPVRVYEGMRICQVYFDTIEGTVDKLYEGKYKDSRGVIESRSHKDFER